MSIIRDLRFGFRVLVKNPGFSAIAVIVLAVGIGANASLFSLVNGILLKPLQLGSPEDLVSVYSKDKVLTDTYRGFSYPNYRDLRDQNSVFESLMAQDLGLVGITEGGDTRRVFAGIVSSNYFETLGVGLAAGRTFSLEEENPGMGLAVAIVSHSYASRRGGPSEVLGKSVRVNGLDFSIIGVAAEGFTGTTALLSPELWIPFGAHHLAVNDFGGGTRPLSERGNHRLMLTGRLKSGYDLTSSSAELAVVAARLEARYPSINRNQTVTVGPSPRLSVSTSPTDETGIGVASTLLMGMTGVVLLIACLNVANLLLARGTARKKEFAIRLAVGGGRSQIVRQLLAEGLMLSLVGGGLGFLVAQSANRLILASFQVISPMPLVVSASPDVRVLVAMMALCIVSTLLFGLWPALRVSRPDLVADLKENSGEDSSPGRRYWSGRNLLVAGQLALSLVLITSAGLFVRSSLAASAVETGLDTDSLLLAELDTSLVGYDSQKGRETYRELKSRIRAIPGVVEVGTSSLIPFGTVSSARRVIPSGTVDDPNASKRPGIGARYTVVDDTYFEAAGIALLEGRVFSSLETRSEQSTPVVIIDQTLAHKLWPDQAAVGQWVYFGSQGSRSAGGDLQVVGVVEHTRDRLFAAGGDQPHVYVPLAQGFVPNMHLLAKTDTSDTDQHSHVLGAIRDQIRGYDDRVPLLSLKSYATHQAGSVEYWVVRAGAQALALLGGLALLLAVAGVYGLKAYTVARRTREIGIRLTLGASSRSAVWLVMNDGLWTSVVGLGVGLALSLGVAQVLSNMLFEVNPADPLVLFAGIVILLIATIVGSGLPALRASRVDPLHAVRCE